MEIEKRYRTMKKKFFTYLMIAAIFTTAFITGAEHGKSIAYNTIEDTMIDPADIVRWNTDGEELSMVLNDGSECYAYKAD